MKILYGKPVADKIYEDIKEEMRIQREECGVETIPTLRIITVGDDPASASYVRGKIKKAAELGIEAHQIKLPETINQYELNQIMSETNADPEIHGCILQLPISKHLNAFEANEKLDSYKDVDGFGLVNTGALALGEDSMLPATSFGIMQLLSFYDIDLEGKNVCIIGRSNIVSKPLFQLMLAKNATVTMCHSKTKDLYHHTLNADIVVSAVGKPFFLNSSHFKDGAAVIDVGINRLSETGQLVGDVWFDDVIKNVTDVQITPVPGGIGLLTVATLMKNVINAWM